MVCLICFGPAVQKPECVIVLFLGNIRYYLNTTTELQLHICFCYDSSILWERICQVTIVQLVCVVHTTYIKNYNQGRQYVKSLFIPIRIKYERRKISVFWFYWLQLTQSKWITRKWWITQSMHRQHCFAFDYCLIFLSMCKL